MVSGNNFPSEVAWFHSIWLKVFSCLLFEILHILACTTLVACLGPGGLVVPWFTLTQVCLSRWHFPLISSWALWGFFFSGLPFIFWWDFRGSVGLFLRDVYHTLSCHGVSHVCGCSLGLHFLLWMSVLMWSGFRLLSLAQIVCAAIFEGASLCILWLGRAGLGLGC